MAKPARGSRRPRRTSRQRSEPEATSRIRRWHPKELSHWKRGRRSMTETLVVGTDQSTCVVRTGSTSPATAHRSLWRPAPLTAPEPWPSGLRERRLAADPSQPNSVTTPSLRARPLLTPCPVHLAFAFGISLAPLFVSDLVRGPRSRSHCRAALAVALAVMLTLHWPPILYLEAGALLVLTIAPFVNLKRATLIVRQVLGLNSDVS